MKGLSKSPLKVSHLSHSFNQSFSNSSARDKSPAPSLEQAISDRIQALNDLQQVQKEVRSLIIAISNINLCL